MKTIGDYEYDEQDEIGRGAFGVVYKGRNKKNLAQVVAVKEIDVKTHTFRHLSDARYREIDILKTLSNARHQNIVTLLYCEFCNGGNLKEYLQCKSKLDESTIRTFLRQIATGLKAVHDNHIIHRDLNPKNILLCFSGTRYPSPENIVLKIGGFGIGRFLPDEEMARRCYGTSLYTALEVVVGLPYGYKADLWCVGVMAYECLIGPLPNSLRFALGGVEIPTNISPDFADLLRGLLELQQHQRLDINQFFNHQFLAAKEVDELEKAAKPAARPDPAPSSSTQSSTDTNRFFA